MPQATRTCVPCAEKRSRAQLQQRLHLERRNSAECQGELPALPRYIRQRCPPRKFMLPLYSRAESHSQGYQKVYRCAIEFLTGPNFAPVSVFEVGTGDGAGLGLMLNAGLIGRYKGIEPDSASYETARQRVGEFSNVELQNSSWFGTEESEPYEFSFCVEVIQHLPSELVPRLLAKLHRLTSGTLFLSTPDAVTSRYGVASTEEWKRVVENSGFDVATVHGSWTTLFVCSPK